jgi:hypothetical protein
MAMFIMQAYFQSWAKCALGEFGKGRNFPTLREHLDQCNKNSLLRGYPFADCWHESPTEERVFRRTCQDQLGLKYERAKPGPRAS